MKLVKFIALIISILCIFCSCNSKDKKKVRVIEMHYNPYTGLFRVIDSNIHIIYVDTMYHTGDFIGSSDRYYKMIN